MHRSKKRKKKRQLERGSNPGSFLKSTELANHDVTLEWVSGFWNVTEILEKLERCGGQWVSKGLCPCNCSDEAYWQLQSCFFSSTNLYAWMSKNTVPFYSVQHVHKRFFVAKHLYQNDCFRMRAQNTPHYIKQLVYTVWTVLHYAAPSLIPGALINPSEFWHIDTKHVWARKVRHST